MVTFSPMTTNIRGLGENSTSSVFATELRRSTLATAMPLRRWTKQYKERLVQVHDAALSTENRLAENFWDVVARRLNEEIGIHPPFTVEAVKRQKYDMEELARKQGLEAPISTGWAKKQCGGLQLAAPPRAVPESPAQAETTLWFPVSGARVKGAPASGMPVSEFVKSGRKVLRWRGVLYHIEVVTGTKMYCMCTLYGVTIAGEKVPLLPDGVSVMMADIDKNGARELSAVRLVVVGPSDCGGGRNEVLLQCVSRFVVSVHSVPEDMQLPAWVSAFAAKYKRERACVLLCSDMEYFESPFLPLSSLHSQGCFAQRLPEEQVAMIRNFPRRESPGVEECVDVGAATSPPTPSTATFAAGGTTSSVAVIDEEQSLRRSMRHASRLLTKIQPRPLEATELIDCMLRGEGVCLLGDPWDDSQSAEASCALRRHAQGDETLHKSAYRESTSPAWAASVLKRIASILEDQHPLQQTRIEHCRDVGDSFSGGIPPTLRQAMEENRDIATLVDTTIRAITACRRRIQAASSILIVTGGHRTRQIANTHFDDHMVVCMTLEGTKTWQTVHPRGIMEEAHGRDTEVAITPDTHPDLKWLEASVRAGQVLVVPAKFWHRVISSGEGTFTYAWGLTLGPV